MIYEDYFDQFQIQMKELNIVEIELNEVIIFIEQVIEKLKLTADIREIEMISSKAIKLI